MASKIYVLDQSDVRPGRIRIPSAVNYHSDISHDSLSRYNFERADIVIYIFDGEYILLKCRYKPEDVKVMVEQIVRFYAQQERFIDDLLLNAVDKFNPDSDSVDLDDPDYLL